MKLFELSLDSMRHSASFATFSERDVLNLQELFLSPGFNYLKVRSIADGRSVVRSVLSLLSSNYNYFSKVACLTTASIAVDDTIISLYDDMALFGALALSHGALDSYLLEYFNYDFVWIECTPELVQAPWFYYFEQRLLDFNLAVQIPILFVELQ